MNPFVFAKSARNILSAVEINCNRLIGRELIPVSRTLNIETSSLCNLECRFCAYVKKQSPKVSMKDPMFEDCVRQAVLMGFREFDLTPCTGDVFMDRRIFHKLQFLEDNPEVEAFDFFTNFTIPKVSDVGRLVRLKKLRTLTISIYGHDLESFIAITRSTDKVYRRLIANLEALLSLLDQRGFNLNLGLRTTRDAPRSSTEIMRLIERFKERGIVTRPSQVYNNWGGYITQEDVKGLAIDVTGPGVIYKNGACVQLFTTVQVMATGIVNGCACRDVDATLRIGDLNESPLRAILTPDNPAYRALIEEQQRGQFRPVCQSCDFYKSIYHKRSSYRQQGIELQSVEAFEDRRRAAVAASSQQPAKDAGGV